MLNIKKLVVFLILLNSSSVYAQQLNVPANLKAHNNEFRKEVVKVTDNVYCAVGYAIANSIMIVGTDGVIIVDVLESPGAAKEVFAEFRKITDKPVKAIVYTHNHTDHTRGAAVFAGNDNPMIICHEDLEAVVSSNAALIKPILEKRSLRMFGVYLNPVDERINAGLGIGMNIKDSEEKGYLKPTITFKDSLNMTIAGVDLKFFHAPGETDDQINVYIPSKKLVCVGDNLYKTFPNLYTIRGTSYRDPVAWYRSIDKVRYLKPEFIAPSHSRPIVGTENVQNTLTTYRDGIQYVFNETIRQMNLGKTPLEISASISLPKHLKDSPFLQEFYGKASWSSRSIFDGILGFFDGNPTTLQPLAPKVESQKMIELAGGMQKMKQNCLDAVAKKDYQWALTLSDHVLNIEPSSQETINARIEALRRLGEAESNPNARNYYLTAAKELAGLKLERNWKISAETLQGIPVMTFFNSMALNLNVNKSIETNKKVQFNFTDINQTATLIIRNGIAEYQEFALPNPDVTVTTTGQAWKEIVSKIKDPIAAVKSGELKISDPVAFKAIMNLFTE